MILPTNLPTLLFLSNLTESGHIFYRSKQHRKNTIQSNEKCANFFYLCK